MFIKSEKDQKKKEETPLQELRQAYEHRATWLYFLLDEAKKRGLDWEKLGREAIFRCGSFHGSEKFPRAESVEEFSSFFPGETAKEVFSMKVKENPPDSMEIEFHYCPLVTAWKRLGLNQEEIALLCDIAMEGDRGILDSFEGLTMELKETIAAGDDMCRLLILKEKREEREEREERERSHS